MKRQSVPGGEFAEIEVHRAAHAAPTWVVILLAAADVGQKVGTIMKIKCDSMICQLAPLSTPIAECVAARHQVVKEGIRGRGAGGCGLSGTPAGGCEDHERHKDNAAEATVSCSGCPHDFPVSPHGRRS